MKIRIASAFCLLTLLSACGQAEAPATQSSEVEETPPVLESDFTPPTGTAKGPGELGPWNNRLILATSEDGQQFESIDLLISDQADVPELVMNEEGRIFLYYIAWTAGERHDTLAVAISDDQGATWAYKYTEFTGWTGERSLHPVDPDVIRLDNGDFRLYFTQFGETHYADSSDGIHFEYGDLAFSGEGNRNILDPNIILIGDIYHLYGGGGPDNWHATSSDGKTFTEEDGLRVSSDGLDFMMSNGIQVEDIYRYWGFSNQGEDVHSWVSTDGYSWESEGVSLAFDENNAMQKGHVKDSSVIQLEDGSFLMVYVTQVP